MRPMGRVACAGMVLLAAASGARCELLERTEPPHEVDMPRIEHQLASYLTSTLSLEGVVVTVDDTSVGVAFAAEGADRGIALGRLTLVATAAAVAAPWAETVHVSPHVGGFPFGAIDVPVQVVRDVANGRAEPQRLLSSWTTSVMPLPLEMPGDLLGPLSGAQGAQGWQLQDRRTVDGLALLVELGLPELHALVPENYEATMATAITGGGQLQVGALDAGTPGGASSLLAALAQKLDERAQATPGGLHVAADPPLTIRALDGVVYFAAGPVERVQSAITALLAAPEAVEPAVSGETQVAAAAGAQGDGEQTGATPTEGGQAAGAQGEAQQVGGQANGGQTEAQQTEAQGQGEQAGPPPHLEPMPVAEDSSVARAVVCLGFDERSRLRGVKDIFPRGTEKVALYLETDGARPNTEIQLTWYHEDDVIGRQILLLSGSKKNISYVYAGNRPDLWVGWYAVEIKENSELVARLTFRVE